MEQELEDEIEAINSIYGERTLTQLETDGLYVLNLPNQETSLRIAFPSTYPDAPPAVIGTERTGDHARKGRAAQILDVFREAVGRIWQPGLVCLYDVLEDISSTMKATESDEIEEKVDNTSTPVTEDSQQTSNAEEPPWTLSDVVIELKSIFIARCAPVSSPTQTHQFLLHLLQTDKKVAKATHNITAHRIKGENGVIYQDCDDDGETAAGGRLLHLLQLMDVWNVTVVVTRWYGGQKLGPARFGIINGVARDALVKGGFHVEGEAGGVKKKGKK